jgi:hypothetical protein
MNPKRGPGWKLLGAILPPACSSLLPHAAQPSSRLALRDASRYEEGSFLAVELPVFVAPALFEDDYAKGW